MNCNMPGCEIPECPFCAAMADENDHHGPPPGKIRIAGHGLLREIHFPDGTILEITRDEMRELWDAIMDDPGFAGPDIGDAVDGEALDDEEITVVIFMSPAPEGNDLRPSLN